MSKEKSLNLLPSQAKFRALRSAIQSKTKLFMWIFGFILIGGSLVVIGFLIMTRQKLNGIVRKYNAVNTELKTMSDAFTTSWGVKYRAKIVGKLLSDRFEYGKSIEKVNGLFSKKVIINSLEIRGINDFLLDAGTDSSEGMDEVEELIEKVRNKSIEGLEKVDLITLNRTGNNWKFKLEVILK